jgi:hypothetical protein
MSAATEVLATARKRGITITARNGRLSVAAPAGTADGELQAALREHKAEILTLLCDPSEAQDRLTEIAAARRSAHLADFKHALRLGTFVLCGDCKHFAFAEAVAGSGMCAMYGVDTEPFIPLSCANYGARKQ